MCDRGDSKFALTAVTQDIDPVAEHAAERPIADHVDHLSENTHLQPRRLRTDIGPQSGHVRAMPANLCLTHVAGTRIVVQARNHADLSGLHVMMSRKGLHTCDADYCGGTTLTSGSNSRSLSIGSVHFPW